MKNVGVSRRRSRRGWLEPDFGGVTQERAKTGLPRRVARQADGLFQIFLFRQREQQPHVRAPPQAAFGKENVRPVGHPANREGTRPDLPRLELFLDGPAHR